MDYKIKYEKYKSKINNLLLGGKTDDKYDDQIIYDTFKNFIYPNQNIFVQIVHFFISLIDELHLLYLPKTKNFNICLI
jgi:hypothetical protein